MGEFELRCRRVVGRLCGVHLHGGYDAVVKQLRKTLVVFFRLIELGFGIPDGRPALVDQAFQLRAVERSELFPFPHGPSFIRIKR